MSTFCCIGYCDQSYFECTSSVLRDKQEIFSLESTQLETESSKLQSNCCGIVWYPVQTVHLVRFMLTSVIGPVLHRYNQQVADSRTLLIHT